MGVRGATKHTETIPAATAVRIVVRIADPTISSARTGDSSEVLTYMRLMNKPRGLLINFNSRYLMDGVKSLILTSPSPGCDEPGGTEKSETEPETAQAQESPAAESD